MIDIGVAGFRFDAAKHMWPDDLENIYGRLHDLSTEYFDDGSQSFIVHEVIDKGEDPVRDTEYTHLGRVTEFNYGPFLAQAVRREISLSELRNLGESEPWELLPSTDALAFLDNHDNQRGGDSEEQVSFKEPHEYRMANAFMLAWPYGAIRLMSSFQFETSDDGPPSLPDGQIASPVIDENGQCAELSGWICEHRWPIIKRMVTFRNVAGDSVISNWWDNGKDQIAFGRGGKAFIVINNEDSQDLDETLATGLPEGEYCDVITGDIDDGGFCTGSTIIVDQDGNADFTISYTLPDPISAIHIDAIVTGGVQVYGSAFVFIVLSCLCSLFLR